MGQDEGAVGASLEGARAPEQTGTRDPEEIRREIEATRQDLGDTVEALAAKADVKARARERIAQTKESVAQKAGDLRSKARETSPDAVASGAAQATQKAKENPLPLGLAGAFGVGFLVGRLTKR
jgi:ElaB/YqjD/DUF883 family membrane-anchored ribosome-binding protein